MNFNDFSERSRRVPGYIRFPIVLVALGIAAYWIFTTSGPFAWFANMQAKLLDGKYYVILTGALTAITTLLPAAIVVSILATFYSGKDKK